MADVKWIKIVTDIFDDEKILLIEAMPEADSIITIWFKLLCLAGKQNNSGVFMLNDRIPFTEEMFSTIFRRKLSTVRLALTTFENLGMVEIVDGVVTIPNWGKHQSLEQIEARKEYRKQYQHDYYLRQKAKAESRTIQQPVNSLSTVDKQNSTTLDIDKNKNEKREEDKSKSNGNARTARFTPPTFEEVSAYCSERRNGIDAQRFIDFYASKGWKVGQTPMKDWKAAVRTWEQRSKSGDVGSGTNTRPNPAQQYAQREYTPEEANDVFADLSRYE